MGLFIYSFFYRDKLMIELQNDYKRELSKQGALIEEGMKRNYPKLKTEEEKEVYKKEVEKKEKDRLLSKRGR